MLFSQPPNHPHQGFNILSFRECYSGIADHDVFKVHPSVLAPGVKPSTYTGAPGWMPLICSHCFAKASI